VARVRSRTIDALHDAPARAAEAWPALESSDSLRSYGFRHGVAHLLATGQAPRGQALLTDFPYLMARLAAENGPGARPLATDAAATQATLADGHAFRLWEAFIQERAHVLRRGNNHWGAQKVLLQLAVEHADESPVTQAAEHWLEGGHCDWLWQRRARRVAKAVPSACLRVFEGHKSMVSGATVLPDGRILSWSWDNTLRLWDGGNGEALGCWQMSSVAHEAPHLHQAWRTASAPDTSLPEAAGSSHAGAAILNLHSQSGGRAASWHGDGNWVVRHLLPTGTLVASCDKHLAFLQLHHGDRRVSIDEAAELLRVGSVAT